MTNGTRRLRYFDIVMVAFVTVLVCSNLIGPAKIAQVEIPGSTVTRREGLRRVSQAFAEIDCCASRLLFR